MGHSQAKIAHLAQNWIFWEISLQWFSTYEAPSCCKIENKSYSRSWDISLHNVRPQSDQNYSFCPNIGFFGNFDFSNFHLIIVRYHTSKIEKNPKSRTWVISLLKYEHNKGFVWKLQLRDFYLIIVPYHPAKLERNVHRADPEKSWERRKV